MNAFEKQQHESEVEHWKFVAAYLASCHAANLEGLTKSAPKLHRNRLTSICSKAALFLRGKESPTWYATQSKAADIEWSTKRCEEAVTKYGPPEPQKQ